MENVISYITCFGWLPLLIPALLGLLLGWVLFRGKKVDGDLSIEGEGALRAEADSLRARVRDLEGNVASRDTEVSGLKSKLAAAAAGAAAVAAVTSKAAPAAAAPVAEVKDDDDTYALEWRNRYLAARVKYLEGRMAETPAPKAKAKAKAAPKAKTKIVPVAKKVKPTKAKAKPVAEKAAAPKPKVLYTDGPTDGAPDDLKLIKGIGPKFEKDLHSKGIYYFRQIGAWKAADVKMVEGVIDSIPGRIKRDEWVKQGKALAKGGATKGKAKPGPKPGTKRSSLTADGTPRKKPGPKGAAKAVMTDAEKYLANVRKYDSKADAAVVDKIVKYCGIALRSRDSSLVACSDRTELETVNEKFVAKKLGITDGGMELAKDTCQTMKGERFKSRVTFYYLLAQKAGKLDVFGG